jgi:hypothetical protein
MSKRKRWTLLFLIVTVIGSLVIGVATLAPGTKTALRMGEVDSPRTVQPRSQEAESNDSGTAEPSRPSPVPAVATRDGPLGIETAWQGEGDDPGVKLRLLVPAYFYPAGQALDDWERIFRAAKRAPVTVIVNPSTGPGDTADPNYVAVIHRAALSHIAIAGYVNTEYAKRTKAEVQADIEKWTRFYPEVGGIFLDSQAPGAEHLDYYAMLRTFVANRIGGGFVITNPGTICVEEYFSRPATDIACVFESTENFDLFRLPPWGRLYPGKDFAALPYGIESLEVMRDYIGRAARGHLGSIYVSDTRAPAPWSRLPRYWEAEVDAVHRVNQKQVP